MRIVKLSFVIFFLGSCFETDGAEEAKTFEEEQYGVKYANDCEVCKYLVVELQKRLEETGKTHDVIKTGYTLDDENKKTTKYRISELRLIESLEDICESMLEYNMHKERKDSTRFAKGMSTTFKTLHGLVDRGVKVELGIPLELWDKPSAEVTHLKSQCEDMIEKHETDIHNWYFKHQDRPLTDYLCAERVLRPGQTECLIETVPPPSEDEDEKEKEKNGERQDKEGSEQETGANEKEEL